MRCLGNVARYCTETIQYHSSYARAWEFRSEQKEMFEEDENQFHALIASGKTLSQEEIDSLENALLAAPDSMELRCRLLSYYFTRQYTGPDLADARMAHILWIIAHAPDARIAGSPYAAVNHLPENAHYAQARALWLEQIQKQPENPKILWNAAHFFLHADRQLSDDLLVKGHRLEPDNPEWLSRRAQWMTILLISCPPEKRSEQALTDLTLFEQVLASEMHPYARLSLLNYAARAAYEAGEYDKARTYAGQLLAAAAENEDDADALHQSNIMLGRIALREDAIESAKSHLLQAGEVSDSPVLGSFGPNMQLAQALLEKGEQETVLLYLQRCGQFWKRDELNVWRAEIQRGETPDFGANLSY